MSGWEKQIREGKPEARFADPGPIPRPPDASSVAAMGNAYCKANARGPENADSRTPYKAAQLPKRCRSPGLSKGGPDSKVRAASILLRFLEMPRSKERCLRHAQ